MLVLVLLMFSTSLNKWDAGRLPWIQNLLHQHSLCRCSPHFPKMTILSVFANTHAVLNPHVVIISNEYEGGFKKNHYAADFHMGPAFNLQKKRIAWCIVGVHANFVFKDFLCYKNWKFQLSCISTVSGYCHFWNLTDSHYCINWCFYK